ncbi:histidinol dehydrogenase [Candidatus Woesearchaeota archaeon]|nr:histidinol dehydrogenase [Candidatus Woesearchaeota archaeon]
MPNFVKVQAYQKLTLKGLNKLSKSALKLSRIEGMDAHNKSIKSRLGKTI